MTAEAAARAADRAARQSYGRLVAYLSARSRNIAAAEDALAEAFRAALEHWPVSGIPAAPEAWLLTCMAYLDLNPVRAGKATQPQDWAWSSHGHYVGAVMDKMVSPHSLSWSLGNTPFAREQAYAQRVEQGVGAAQQQALVDSALHGWALGDEAFLAALQKQTPRRLSRGKPGRPRRPAVEATEAAAPSGDLPSTSDAL